MGKAPGRLSAGPPKDAGMSSRSGARSVESFPRRSGAVLSRERRASPFFGEGELHSPCPLVSWDETSTLNLPSAPGIFLQNTDCPAHPIVHSSGPRGLPRSLSHHIYYLGLENLTPLTASSVSPSLNQGLQLQKRTAGSSWGRELGLWLRENSGGLKGLAEQPSTPTPTTLPTPILPGTAPCLSPSESIPALGGWGPAPGELWVNGVLPRVPKQLSPLSPVLLPH